MDIEQLPTVERVTPDHEVVIVGAGFGGIGAGISLQRRGIHDFVIVDKWDQVGGTWHANTYPGVAVDIPSFVYSFSYEQRGDWSRIFAPGYELRDYASDLVDKYGLAQKLRLNTTITSAVLDERNSLWRLTTDADQEITGRNVVMAVGGLERPKMPDIPGLDEFGGVLMHTALWDHDVALAGKRVAVIGTGATALQVVPAIVDEVEHLTVFQRTPIWVFPKPDKEVTSAIRWVLGRKRIRSGIRLVGTVATEVGMAGMWVGPQWLTNASRRMLEVPTRRWMRRQIDDPVVREKLIPRYGLGCKRPSMSNDYLRTFNRDDVSLVTDAIECITKKGVRTADGVEHEIDVLICATGFKLWEAGAVPPFPVIGRGGVDLGRFWSEQRYQSYQGVSVPGFPNMFSITGPYGFVLGSYLWMIEATSAHLSRAIAEAKRRGATVCEIRQEAHDEYFRKCLKRQQNNFLFTPACAGSNTYYINNQGDSPFRPSTHGEMYWQNRYYNLDVYRYSRGVAVLDAAAAMTKESL
ncbi:NAD(P)/FAD-dependent oxidoreductase [Mycobacterium intracellulare]|uniref:NAD(P)/FAD-dependent oxidoreductase n=1 Tax=Mycobacterium kubicae TaxID=120959 RepID=A0AAX1JHE6_9MYCO|nr:NAD(P)/FAD-dependent oxidoreductase [Mycobacterium avium]MCA2245360.1 NAD(P)/FAD-dependent oxidoreductase [Mycobacterium sp. WUMAC-067]MCA2276293.1 NAD(P)/FAD-dependent oxidoreductase [Mycobacterium intracellulare]MCA2311858.1 NAD(P)/FAD-dependent oxidoreductase [Mycobacterium intracellulare subsp. chimaera]MCA2317290.1 NAD(P)/FAD-dependent oxidoreductase [Mycobacterium sp. WUMAC-025]MCA4721083.1 NAD(P)/FAD-dependent oxidoreductase [Mycobacterium avium subsp. hominissuis]MCV7004632.1 NAD(P